MKEREYGGGKGGRNWGGRGRGLECGQRHISEWTEGESESKRDGQLIERKKGRKRKGEWGRTISYNVGKIDYW